jgi:hypothetical protein
MSLTPEKIKELKDAHGDLVCVESKSGPLVFRRPTRTEYDRWFDLMQSDKGNASRHARQLAKACRVYPDEQGFDAALDRQPALCSREILDAVTELAGLGDDEVKVKKL